MHSKKQKKQTLILVLIVLIVIAVIVAIRNSNKKDKIVGNVQLDNTVQVENKNNNSLIGTYIYSIDGTKYEFKEDGSGSMSSKDFNFEYTYTTHQNILTIDFRAEEVHDVKYTYKIDGNELTLTSLEGTISVGKEYKLEKENK